MADTSSWDTMQIEVASTALVQQIDGEAVVLDARTETYFELNEVGAFVLEALGSPRTGRDLTAAIVEGFDVEVETAAADLAGLLDELLDRGLITAS